MNIRNTLGLVLGVVIFYLVSAFVGDDIAWVTRLYNGEGDEFERGAVLLFAVLFGGLGMVVADAN